VIKKNSTIVPYFNIRFKGKKSYTTELIYKRESSFIKLKVKCRIIFQLSKEKTIADQERINP